MYYDYTSFLSQFPSGVYYYPIIYLLSFLGVDNQFFTKPTYRSVNILSTHLSTPCNLSILFFPQRHTSKNLPFFYWTQSGFLQVCYTAVILGFFPTIVLDLGIPPTSLLCGNAHFLIRVSSPFLVYSLIVELPEKGCKGSTRRGDLVQGKEQQLRFAGAAMKRHARSKVRETQVRW